MNMPRRFEKYLELQILHACVIFDILIDTSLYISKVYNFNQCAIDSLPDSLQLWQVELITPQ